MDDIIIKNKLLKEINYNDTFFDSLRNDYYNFNNWFITKQNNNERAYVTYKNNKLTSFLLLKIENEEEQYLDFIKPFSKNKRLKICTFKVIDINKNIGKEFIKIIENYAKKNNINEIYITINPKHKELINFIEKYNFIYYTDKSAKDSKGNIILEKVYVKRND